MNTDLASIFPIDEVNPKDEQMSTRLWLGKWA